MAALLAASAEPAPDVAFVPLTSDGVTLIYGKDEQAIEAARLLKDHLDVTVLIKPPADVAPPRATDFPVVKGAIRQAKGYLGAFELTVDDYAAPTPSSRGGLVFGPARNGATSRCDIVLDLSGGAPLFPAADLRDGYLRADPGDPAAVLRAVLKARDLIGTFDKPRYITFTEDLCAHSRSKIVGCRRCLDLCPTGAITPNGDHVAIDAQICAGCGQCAAACPTGAAAYALPPSDALLRTLARAARRLPRSRRPAGRGDVSRRRARRRIDRRAGAARRRLAGECAAGASQRSHAGRAGSGGGGVCLRRVGGAVSSTAPSRATISAASPRPSRWRSRSLPASALPASASRRSIPTIRTRSGSALRAIASMDAAAKPATFAAAGLKRDVVRQALRELHAAAPSPIDIVPLPQGAPFGTVEVNVEGCTLCLSCVSACPTGALSDDPETPMLRFAEDACVQCGLCKATCPEKVITLKPQIDFRAATASSRIIKQEQPFDCIRCGKPFGVKSSVERVAAKLEASHWMFANSKKRLDVIKMCADCRVSAMAEEKFDPFAGPKRPTVRTTDDYLREREQKGDT